MSKFAVVIPAAGKSSRFGNKQRKKPFLDLKGRPVWLRAAESFANHDDVVQTIVVVSPDDMEWFRDKYKPNLAFMSVELVEGGAERADSVANGLAHVRENIDFVAVHDAARPLLTKQAIDVVFSAAEEHGAAIPALRVSSTVKRVQDAEIVETVPSRGTLARPDSPGFSKRIAPRSVCPARRFSADRRSAIGRTLGQKGCHRRGVSLECETDDFGGSSRRTGIRRHRGKEQELIHSPPVCGRQPALVFGIRRSEDPFFLWLNSSHPSFRAGQFGESSADGDVEGHDDRECDQREDQHQARPGIGASSNEDR